MAESTSKNQNIDRKELFERAPVPKALAAFAVPTVISQLVAMIYNLADTYFVGRTDNPYMVAAVTLSFTLYAMLNAFGQLFGIGGGALTSKLLGEYREDEARLVGCFSFYSSLIIVCLISVFVFMFQDSILGFLGTSPDTIEYARQYAIYVVIIGGIPTVQSICLSHLIRNEGYAKQASFGLAMGGVLNIILDPIFMFVIFEPGNEVKGAAVATMLSNFVVVAYYIGLYITKRESMILDLDIRNYAKGAGYLGRILEIGFPSFLAPFLSTVAVSFTNRLCATYGDVAVAAFGIAKKIDMLPMNTALGMCQGMVALVSYNYANKNYKRMKSFIDTTRLVGLGFAAFCIVVFQSFTPHIVRLFIKDPATVEIGVMALRRACLSTPFMISVFHMTYTYQSMGFGRPALIMTVFRQAVINIPMLYIMKHFFGLPGLYWTQLVTDIIVISVSSIFYKRKMREIEKSFNVTEVVDDENMYNS